MAITDLAAHVGLIVELVEVDQASKDDAHVLVVLRVFGGFFQLVRHVLWYNVVEQPVGLRVEQRRLNNLEDNIYSQCPRVGAERRSCLVRLLFLPMPLNRDLEIGPGLGVCEAGE